jgi:sorbitol-specific phosphotransferase system component IIA
MRGDLTHFYPRLSRNYEVMATGDELADRVAELFLGWVTWVFDRCFDAPSLPNIQDQKTREGRS